MISDGKKNIIVMKRFYDMIKLKEKRKGESYG